MDLLTQLLELAKKGASRPLVLWLEEYKQIAAGIYPELEHILTSLEDKGSVHQEVKKLINLLKQDTPDELSLAESLSYVAEIFQEEAAGPQKTQINEYIQTVMRFRTQAEMDSMYRKKREIVKKTLSETEIEEYDKKLFAHEGMIYCLEYYLAVYKAVLDAPNEEEKQKFIVNQEINLGFGNVPGLRIDFSRDEVLGKFIYSILNDELRTQLTRDYFTIKDVLMSIPAVCSSKTVCTYDFNKVTTVEIVGAFKKFIEQLFVAFTNIGIEKLSSFFFTPYGKKPKIKEIIL